MADKLRVRVVEDVLTTDTAGGVVESLPVLDVVDDLVQDTAGTWIAPVELEEADDGVPVRFVDDAIVLNSVGTPVAATPTRGVYRFDNEEAAALVAEMVPRPNNARKEAIDALYSALKLGETSGSNILAKLDMLFLFGAHNAQAAPLNWAGAADLSIIGSLTYEVDGGYVGNGVDGYLSAGLAPGGLTKFTQNSAFACVGVNVDGANTNSVVGQAGSGTGRLLVNPRTGTGAVSGRLNTATTFTTTATVASRLGRTEFSRVNSTQTSVYKDGALVETVASTSATPSSQTELITVLRNNTTYLDDGVNVFALGSGLTASEVADFDAAIEAYATTIEPP
jgi:hypothetical protein